MLRRMCILALPLVAFFFLSTAAVAETMKFPYFSMDVPSRWAAGMEGDTVFLVARDNSASLSITMSRTEGRTAEELADFFVKKLDGSELQQEGDVYTFYLTSGEARGDAVLKVEGDVYALFVFTGDHPDVEGMIDSMQNRPHSK